MTDALSLADELADYRKFRYMGDCKCGDCQLIPMPLLNRVIDHLRAGYSPDSNSDAFAMHLLDVAYRHISESDAVLSTKARANLIERARATFPSGQPQEPPR